MRGFKQGIGYSIAAVSAAASAALIVDRYAEYAAGAESILSWALPPVALFALAMSTFAAVRFGYPSDAQMNGELTASVHQRDCRIEEPAAQFRENAQ